jgi:Domain of unknown function (DUF4878)
MKYKILLPVFLFAALACNNNDSYKNAEDAQDAARQFIRASLDGDYNKANFYLYADSTNKFLIERWKRNYINLSEEERQKYKDANIIVLNMDAENDSVTRFRYLNSYKKDTTTIKILRINGEWLVDLKELIKY